MHTTAMSLFQEIPVGERRRSEDALPSDPSEDALPTDPSGDARRSEERGRTFSGAGLERLEQADWSERFFLFLVPGMRAAVGREDMPAAASWALMVRMLASMPMRSAWYSASVRCFMA